MKSIVVAAPVQRVYAIWTDFTRYPRFIPGVQQVRVEGRRMHWQIERDDGITERETVISELSPNCRVAWRAADGGHRNVVVTMRPAGPAHTLVGLGAEYTADPTSSDNIGARFQKCLDRFKALIERTENE